MVLLQELFGFGDKGTFKAGQYVERRTRTKNFVYRIDSVDDTGYVVSIPHFSEEGFRWSRPQHVDFNFLRDAVVMPASVAQKYHSLRTTSKHPTV